MTDARVTQIAVEEWGGSAAARITQIAVEEWGQVVPIQASVTIIAVEQWGQVPATGGCSLYGIGKYGRALYSGCNYVACAGSLPLNFSLHALLDIPTEILLSGSLPLRITPVGDLTRSNMRALAGNLSLRFSFKAPLTAAATMKGALSLHMQMPSPLDVLVYTGPEWLPAVPCDQTWTETSCPDGVWQATDPCSSPWEST